MDTYHVEALVCKLSCLIARSTVDASPLTILHGCLVNLGNGLLQVLVHGPIQDWMPDVIPQIERPNQEYVDPGNFCNGIYLASPRHDQLRARYSPSFGVWESCHTFSRASLVSICTTVTNASFACCKYSADVCPPNFSIGNGDPNPL